MDLVVSTILLSTFAALEQIGLRPLNGSELSLVNAGLDKSFSLSANLEGEKNGDEKEVIIGRAPTIGAYKDNSGTSVPR